MYNSDPEVQVWFRKIWSLSMVPHKDIVSTWEKISDDVPLLEEEEDDNRAGEQLNMGFRNFVHYFDKTWVGTQADKTHAEKNGKRRKALRYPWSSWNHRQDILQSREITSNQSESYNSSLNCNIQKEALIEVRATVDLAMVVEKVLTPAEVRTPSYLCRLD